MEVREGEIVCGMGKVQGKLTPVIGLECRGTIGQRNRAFLQKVRCGGAPVIGVGGCKCCSPLRINTREDVALRSVNEPYHGIRFKHAVSSGTAEFLDPWLSSALNEVAGLPGKRESYGRRQASRFLEIRQCPAGERDGYGESLIMEEWRELLFPETGMGSAKRDDLSSESLWVYPPASIAGRRTVGIQRIEFPPFSSERRLPPVQSAAGDLECVSCCCIPVFLPE